MITKAEYEKAIATITQYKKEQLELRRENCSKVAITSIPQKDWGVHITHCCFEHGCKYGDNECPVELGIVFKKGNVNIVICMKMISKFILDNYF